MTARVRRRAAERIPLMPLRSTTVYPTGVIGVQVGMPGTLEMLARHPEPGLVVAVVVAPGEPDDPIANSSLEKIAVRARVSDRLNLPGGTVQATVQGFERVRLAEVHEQEGYLTGLALPAPEVPVADEVEAHELIARIVNSLEALAAEVERLPREVPRILRMNLADPGRFADLVATLANFSVASKDEVVQRLDVMERLQYECDELEEALTRLRPHPEAEVEASPPAEKPAPRTAAERAADVRQRIKLLQAELGEIDPLEREVIDAMRRVEASGLPARTAVAARAEIERLRTIPPGSGEASEVRSYVDWLLHMPWRARATAGPGSIDLEPAPPPDRAP